MGALVSVVVGYVFRHGCLAPNSNRISQCALFQGNCLVAFHLASQSLGSGIIVHGVAGCNQPSGKHRHVVRAATVEIPPTQGHQLSHVVYHATSVLKENYLARSAGTQISDSPDWCVVATCFLWTSGHPPGWRIQPGHGPDHETAAQHQSHTASGARGIVCK